MARPRIHDESTGEALLDAAAGLLRNGGPGALSVRSVAGASGRSFRAVYAVFGSKQALIDALAERGYRSLTERVHSIRGTDDARASLVSAGVDAFRPFALSETELFRLTFEQVSAEVLQQRQVGRAALASYEALAFWIRRLRAVGGIHESWTEEACVFSFSSFCQGLASSELAFRQPPDGPGFWPMARDLDLEQLWKDALTALVVGFESERG